MPRLFVLGITCVLAAATAQAEERAAEGEKQLSGMSVLGNDDAPKALVIVPWKSSVLGDTLSVSRMLDEGLQPVDRDVFSRELAYYRIRAASSAGLPPDAK
jgi:hypothetical protein